MIVRGDCVENTKDNKRVIQETDGSYRGSIEQRSGIVDKKCQTQEDDEYSEDDVKDRHRLEHSASGWSC